MILNHHEIKLKDSPLNVSNVVDKEKETAVEEVRNSEAVIETEETALDEEMRGTNYIVLDFSAVSYISGWGVGGASKVTYYPFYVSKRRRLL